MAEIHPTAVIDRRVELGDGVRIGPYAIIEGAVQIGDGSVIDAHSIVRGHTLIGTKCRIGPAAYVGLDPQHLKFDSSTITSLIIGDGTIIREGASVHRSITPGLDHATRIGCKCFLMGQSHVAHDCQLGDEVILANGVLLGGHVEVGNKIFFGGGCVVHQFCRIGRLAIISGNEAVTHDIPPFAAMRYCGLKAYNAVGCRRAGISRDGLRAIRAAYSYLHSHRNTSSAVEAVTRLGTHIPEIQELLDFIASSERGIQRSVHFVSQAHATADEDE